MILKPSALSSAWTFPSILLSAFVIAWGAEAAQFLISQGLALAILAWLQTLPEFAVEAVIAWNAGKDPSQTHLAIANFTGSLRLLVGLGWPILYFTFIWWKGSLTLWDAFPLAACYVLYLFVLWKIPPREQEEEALDDLGVIPRRVLQMQPKPRGTSILLLFVV